MTLIREKLLPGNFYHVYNRSVGNENLFRSPDNYFYFISKIKTYLLPVCNVHAYCLMPTHFHFLIEVKNEHHLFDHFQSSIDKFIRRKYISGNESELSAFPEFTLIKHAIIEDEILKQFSRLFNCYAQSYNKMYERHGSLFQESFKRKCISDTDYLKLAVLYIHNNPVRHGYTSVMKEWNFSSFRTYKRGIPSWIETKHVLNVFGGYEDFMEEHHSFACSELA